MKHLHITHTASNGDRMEWVHVDGYAGDFVAPRMQGGTPFASRVEAELELANVQDCYGIEGIRIEEIK